MRETFLKYPENFKKTPDCFLISASPDKLELVKSEYRFLTRSKIDSRCCICGSTEQIEMHHVKHIRKGGKNPNKGFNRLMANLNRKQIPVCEECHDHIHAGRYDGKSLSDFADAHLAAR